MKKTLAPYGQQTPPFRKPQSLTTKTAERKVRSDKLVDIKIPVTTEEYRWLRTKAAREKSNVTKLVSEYLSESIPYIPILARPSGIQTYKFVHARISQDLHLSLLDKAIVIDLSIRQAARYLLNRIWKS